MPAVDIRSSTLETRTLQVEGKVDRSFQILAALFQIVEVLQGEEAPFAIVVSRVVGEEFRVCIRSTVFVGRGLSFGKGREIHSVGFAGCRRVRSCECVDQVGVLSVRIGCLLKEPAVVSVGIVTFITVAENANIGRGVSRGHPFHQTALRSTDVLCEVERARTILQRRSFQCPKRHRVVFQRGMHAPVASHVEKLA